MNLRCVLSALALLALPAAAAPAEEPEWTRFADVDTVEVETEDEDGDERETTVWLLVLDGDAYIRTGGTTWGDNVERSPDIEVEIELEGSEEELDVRAVPVTDEALRERIHAGFNEKYGWSDSVIGWFRGSNPRIWRLVPR